MVPAELKMSLEKALKQSPDLKQAYDTEEVTRELIDTAFVLEDLTRNASVHAAGVVIGDQLYQICCPQAGRRRHDRGRSTRWDRWATSVCSRWISLDSRL